MDRLPNPHILTIVVSLLAVGLAAGPAAAAGPMPAGVSAYCRPVRPESLPVGDVAKAIDWLERRIETYGTVVAKQPDIWGEARLTKHRHEIERELATELTKFRETLQGSMRRSDQSFLGMAMTLSAAAGGTEGGETTSAENNVSFPATELITSAPDAVSRTDLPKGFGEYVPFKEQTDGKLKISLEPTVYLAQKTRYLNYLSELRRINEGDDTADSPGYSLCLVRIPVSVFPGKKTFKGYGAEITITAEPSLSEELLPETFRNLVINDVVDQLSLPLTKLLHARWGDEDFWKQLRDAHRATQELVLFFDYEQQLKKRSDYNDYLPDLREIERRIVSRYPHLVSAATESSTMRAYSADSAPAPSGHPAQDLLLRATQKYFRGEREESTWQEERMALTPPIWERKLQQRREELRDNMSLDPEKAGALRDELRSLIMHGMSGLRSRRSGLAYPPSQLPELAGRDLNFWAPLALTAYEGLKNVVHAHEQVHLGDVRVFLQDEVDAAYDFLCRDDTAALWIHCNKYLVEAIRGRRRSKWVVEPNATDVDDVSRPALRFDEGAIADHRQGLRQAIRELHREPSNFQIACDAEYASTAVLAWAIIVESALLNDRLMEDMRTVAREKGSHCMLQEGEWRQFYLPKPWPEDRAAFNEYVRCRWPVVVFALDPVIDEQNIAELFSVRREMQLAAAVALAAGEIRPSAALNFVRRVETDVETIALNRTIVGFSHGSDTFGWRYYPRLQTPPTVNGVTAFMETLLGGPTSRQLMQRRQLEPGTRECVAVMVLPSFVPYVQLDTRASWFSLNNPRNKELTVNEAMEISRTYQSVRNAMGCMCDSGAYRPGDVCRLNRVVDQLDRRLPLQTTLVPVPFENTLGGFEMFSSGVTDLGPELVGWYGAPGVRVDDAKSTYAGCPADGVAFQGGENPVTQCRGTCGGTTLFLVGDNFSVHDTKVIAGGRCVPYELLSRQVMRVTIPLDVNPVTADKQQVVDVHVATPYGVSRSLSIPVANPEPDDPKPPGSGFSWARNEPYGAMIVRELRCCGPTGKWSCAAQLLRDPGNALPKELQISTPDWSKFPQKSFLPAKGTLAVYVTVKLTNGSVKPPKKRFEKMLAVEYNPGGKKLVTTRGGGDELWGYLCDSVPDWIALGDEPAEVLCTGFLRFDDWPIVPLDDALTIKIHAAPALAECTPCGDSTKIFRLPPVGLEGGFSPDRPKSAVSPGLPSFPADSTSSGQ
ncbi:MAG TPA: hypothetical protein VMY37_21955 [Thermoguttaceae bacterium]|nr:hypothetical protein [Thermoguttaceae bacterium]